MSTADQNPEIFLDDIFGQNPDHLTVLDELAELCTLAQAKACWVVDPQGQLQGGWKPDNDHHWIEPPPNLPDPADLSAENGPVNHGQLRLLPVGAPEEKPEWLVLEFVEPPAQLDQEIADRLVHEGRLLLRIIRLRAERDLHQARLQQLEREHRAFQQEHRRVLATSLEERDARLQEQKTYMQRLEQDVAERTSELRLRSEELEKANFAAEAANHAKSEFLAMMSHEIRTPLNGVICATHLLAETGLDSKQHEYVDMASSSAEALLALINDILDFSKIEAGRMELEQVEFDLRAITESVAEIFRGNAEEKDIVITCLIEHEIPARVIGDPARHRQILLNLVSNAIKFTNHGDVFIHSRLAGKNENTLRVVTEVTDTGVGIPPDRLRRLFEAFSQADSSTSRNYGGTGLGLAICQQLCEMMGGEISCESEHRVGSTFTFEIDLRSVPETGAYIPPVPDQVDHARILVAGPHAPTREAICYYLGDWECVTSQEAGLGPTLEALRVAGNGQTPFRLAIIDVNLLLQDPETIEQLQQVCADKTALIPLVALKNEDQWKELAPEHTALMLETPVRQKALYNCVARAVGAPGIDVPASRSAPRQTLVLPAEQLSRVKIMLAEDNFVNQRVVQEILSRYGLSCTLVRNGHEVLEQLAKEHYDLILMDCRMPEMDGFEATRQIRALPGKQGLIPIVALTADATQRALENCQAAGMDDFLTKPFRLSDMILILNKYLARLPLAEQERVPLAPQETDAKPVSLEVLNEYVGDDPKALATILGHFLDDLQAGQEQLVQRLDQQNTAQVRTCAHSIKGLAANLKAESLRGCAERIQNLAEDKNLNAVQAALPALQESLDQVTEAVEVLLGDIGKQNSE